jgi:hypothetical protein
MRYPAKTEIKKVFLIYCSIINFWTIIIFFYNLPGLIKQLKISEIFGVFSYILMYALLESISITVGLVLLSILLPSKFLRNELATRGTLYLIIGIIIIIPFHLHYPRLSNWEFSDQNIVILSFWGLLYLLLIFMVHLVLKRSVNTLTKIEAGVSKLTALGVIYLIFDLISLLYVIFTL